MTISYSKSAARTVAIATLGLATLSFSPVSSAQDILSGWKGVVSIGANRSSGNSETKSLNGSVRIGKSVGKWEHLVFASIFRGQSTLVATVPGAAGPMSTIVSGDTSDRFAIGYQPKYLLNDRTYLFGILDYEEDVPANIEDSTRQIIGIGYKIFNDSTQTFSGELGIGNRSLTAVDGNDIDGAIGYLGLNYLAVLGPTAVFNADLRSDFGSDNTFTELALGLSFKLSGRFSVKLSHFIRNNTDLISTTNPLAGSTDQVSTFSLDFAI